MINHEFVEILRKMNEIHTKKAADYAQEGNPYSNFERAAMLSNWFNNPIDKAFVTLIGVKLARLAELCNGKEAKNESVIDSHLDLCVYCVLWNSYHQSRQSKGNQLLPIPEKAESKSLHDRDKDACLQVRDDLANQSRAKEKL